MKTLIGVILAIAIFVGTALAINDQYQTRLITSSTLTIHVKDTEFLTIRNFTQDNANSGQRGVVVAGVNPTPTPTIAPSPTATATATPTSTDLIATKTNNVGGNDVFPNSWTWTIHVANTGGADATFASGDVILSDNLPNANITYGTPQVINQNGITTFSATIDCSIDGSFNLTCMVSGLAVAIAAGGSFDVSITATPSTMGNFTNPRAGGGCSVDPNNVVTEANENNNTCTDTVVSGTPTPTPSPTPSPTPVSGTVLTATVLNPIGILPSQAIPSGESVKPILIAGPAILTIAPVPGTTLAITYRKSLQRIQATPTATASSSASITGSGSTFSTSKSSSVSGAASSHTTTVTASTVTDDDDDSSSPTPTPASTSTLRPTPTPSAIPTPTPSPSAIPTPTSSPK